MPIEAIIWDMGGVIMRTMDLSPRAALAARLGMSYEDLARKLFDGPESAKAQLGEITAQQFWQATSSRYGMEPDVFMAEFFRGDLIDHELVAAIRRLRKQYKTGLLSNAFDDLRYWVTEDWKIEDAFNTLIISAEVKMVKPDPAIYAHALERLGVPSSESVFIDDMTANVEAARKAGMYGIQFTLRQQALGELQALLEGK